MKTVTVHVAKTTLSKLLAQVETGEEVIIARGEQPIAKLVPFQAPVKKKRVPGAWAGKVSIGPEFFEPLPPDELEGWGE